MLVRAFKHLRLVFDESAHPRVQSKRRIAHRGIASRVKKRGKGKAKADKAQITKSATFSRLRQEPTQAEASIAHRPTQSRKHGYRVSDS
jgi:hypothetical protein